ncbi:HNH endonuclease [Neobacillus bataviensis LMG 21833]|uniref:HNH endonuclease n=1 Tax=Neobacillus bataviensis LMG 21833 TaxID=1117379 RepID=K6C4J9_9BACI|nr:HNH endonuclease [Neobacillus bataviensis]EKN66035.1 HNH endonuclease [Neobacillus bataviensis LMG 21833]
MNEKRTCRICGDSKEIGDFEKDSRCEGLYTTRCRVCKLKSADKANHAFYKLKQRAEADDHKVEVTLEEVKALFETFDGHCIYCGAKEDPDGPTFHLEHIYARSQGGRNHISNLVISCPTCNAKKGAKPVVDYFFANRDRFGDKNFTLLAYYVAITSRQPVEEIVFGMVNQYADYKTQKIWTDLSK